MKMILTSVVILLLAFSMTVFGQSKVEDSPYNRPLRVSSYQAETTVLQARNIGTVVLREKDTLAVMMKLKIIDHLPQDLELVLLLDGEETGFPIGVLGVEDNVTTFGFIVEDTGRLRESATIAVQVGHEEKTRAKYKKSFQRKSISPLGEEQANKFNLPRTIPE